MAAFNLRVRGSEGDGSALVAEGENEGGQRLFGSAPRAWKGARQAAAAPGRLPEEEDGGGDFLILYAF
jgi:hypothetical protein